MPTKPANILAPISVPATPPAPKPVAPPSVASLTTPGAGYVSSDPAIRAQVEAMSRAAEASVPKPPTPTAPPGAVTAAPAAPSAQGTYTQAPGTTPPVTGPATPPVATTPQTFTQDQATAQAIQSVMAAYKVDQATAATIYQNAKAQQSGQGTAPPVSGAVYDARTNSYKDPLTGNFYAGFDPNLGHVFTQDQRAQVAQMMQMPEGGVLDTSSYEGATQALGSAIQTAMMNPLPHAGTVNSQGQNLTGSGSIVGAAFNAIDPTGSDPTLAALQAQITRQGAMMTDPTLDPSFVALMNLQQQNADIQKATVGDIQSQADQQMQLQQKANDQAMGQAKVLMASLGITGSSMEFGFLAGVQAQGEQALQSVALAEQHAITQANIAYQQGNMDTAFKMADLADKRRSDYVSMLQNQFQLSQSVQDMAMKRAQFQMTLDQNQQQTMATKLDYATKSGADWSTLTPAFQQQVMQTTGMDAAGAASYFKNVSLNQQMAQAKSVADLQASWDANVATKASLALKIPQGQTYSETLPDGTKLTINGMMQGYKSSTMVMSNPDGTATNYLVTYDQAGNVVNMVPVGNHFIAPHFNADTNSYVTFDPNTGSNTTVANLGANNEGVNAVSDGNAYVQNLVNEGYQITQGPGGGYSHNKLTGWDISMPVGTPIPATGNGVVKQVGTDPAYGNFVDVMDMNSGYITRYGHLSQVDAQQGQFVGGQTVLGLSGGAPGAAGSGDSTGPHLHYELRTADDKAIFPNRAASAQAPAPSAVPTPTAQQAPLPPPDQRTDAQWIQAFQDARGGVPYNPQSKSDRNSLIAFRNTQTTQARAEDTAARQTLSTITRDPAFVKATENLPMRMTAYEEFTKAYQMAIKDPQSGVAARQLMASLERVTHPNPQTVIRPSEIANLENTQSLDQKAQSALQKIQTGQSLVPQQINDMKALADNAIQAERGGYDMQLTRAYEQAIKLGIDPSLVGYPIKQVIVTSPEGQQFTAASINDPDLIDAVKNKGYTLQVKS